MFTELFNIFKIKPIVVQPTQRAPLITTNVTCILCNERITDFDKHNCLFRTNKVEFVLNKF